MILALCKKKTPATANNPLLEAGRTYYVQIETGYRSGKHIIKLTLDDGTQFCYASVQLLMRDWKITSEYEDPAWIESLAERDKRLEDLWLMLGDVPMNQETECIEEPFLRFEAGTHREEIWRWFDNRHSKGVGWLMNELTKDSDS